MSNVTESNPMLVYIRRYPAVERHKYVADSEAVVVALQWIKRFTRYVKGDSLNTDLDRVSQHKIEKP